VPRRNCATAGAGYELVVARDQRVARRFKRNGQLGNLTISVAKVVTRSKEEPMTSATLNPGGRLRAALACTVLAACSAVGAIGTASAAGADSPALKVRYSDLNLSTEQGSLALYGRIVEAARQVCTVDSIRDLRAVAATAACREQAIAQAVRDVNSPMLASVYAERLRHG
jgi:UrcA family protein